MAIDLLNLWKMEWDNLPLDSVGTQWPSNLASYLSARVSTKMMFAPPTGGPPPIFTFSQATFSGPLLSLAPSQDSVSPATTIASAWQAAILASSMVATPGLFSPAPTPATTFTVVQAVIPEPASLSAAMAVLASTLASAPLAQGPLTSVYPDAFFTAFSSLMFLITGLNAIPPPAGPLPLVITTGVI